MHDGPVYVYFSLKKHKLKFLGMNSETFVCQLLVQYQIYLARESCFLAQIMLFLILALPCQINQISNSSQSSNCILLFHDVKIDWNNRGYTIVDVWMI